MGKGGQSECVGTKELKECSPSRVGDVVLPKSSEDLQSEERGDRSPGPRARKGAGTMDAYTLTFLLSTGRDEIGLERDPNRDMSVVGVQPGGMLAYEGLDMPCDCYQKYYHAVRGELRHLV